jgi:hypothetical protein
LQQVQGVAVGLVDPSLRKGAKDGAPGLLWRYQVRVPHP